MIYSIPDNHKQCPECRMLRHFQRFTIKRSAHDGLTTSCSECISQYQRLHKLKDRRVKEIPMDIIGTNDNIIRNADHHNRKFLSDFLHSLDYTMIGVAYSIPRCKDYTFKMTREANSSIVDLVLVAKDDPQDILMSGINLLRHTVDHFVEAIEDFRVDSEVGMRMAKYYIYDRV